MRTMDLIEEEVLEAEVLDKADIYLAEYREELLDSDEINLAEDAFIRGHETA